MIFVFVAIGLVVPIATKLIRLKSDGKSDGSNGETVTGEAICL